MKKKYYGLQILRFFAASFVVVDHSLSSILNLQPTANFFKNPWSFGNIGVLVFFGISGFIMVITRYNSFGSCEQAVQFFISRLLRILPIYAIATTLQFISRCIKAYSFGLDFDFLSFAKSLLFIPYLNFNGEYRPVLGQGWTLNYEMFFYFFFGLSLFFNRRIGISICIFYFIIVSSLDGVNFTDSDVLRFYADTILLYFVCGMLVALFVLHYKPNIDSIFLPMLFLLISMFGIAALQKYRFDEYFLVISLVAIMITLFVGASCQPLQRGKFQIFLESLGDASYSTYLFHNFVLNALNKTIFIRLAHEEYYELVGYVLFVVVVANIVGMIIYRCVELPIYKYLNNKIG